MQKRIKDLLATSPIEIEGISGNPGTLRNGMLWYDSTAGAFKVRANGATVNVSSGGVGQRFANAAARAAATPVSIGELGVQLDNLSLWQATGLSAGDWQSYFALEQLYAGIPGSTQGAFAITGPSGTYIAIFDSGAIAGSNKTYTLPNASGAMVLDTATQTLTNKTINAGSNTITGIHPLAIFYDQKSNSVSGDALAATTWQKLTLNTEHCDTGNAFSVSSSVITVGTSGTYRVRAKTQFITSGTCILRLRRTNNTAATLAVSQTVYSWGGDFTSSVAEISARVTLTAGDTLELQGYGQAAGNIGYSAGSMGDGEVRIYSILEFVKE